MSVIIQYIKHGKEILDAINFVILRAVPTIVIAHTFCASRDTRISCGWCLLRLGFFRAVQNYAEKA